MEFVPPKTRKKMAQQQKNKRAEEDVEVESYEASDRVEEAQSVSEDACCTLDDIDDVLEMIEEDDDPEPQRENYYNFEEDDFEAYTRGRKTFITDWIAWAERNGMEGCTC